MADEETKKLNDKSLEDAAGGFVNVFNPEKYSIEEYNRWGITWESNVFRKDRYIVYGKFISQEWAEKIVAKSQEKNERLSERDLSLMGVPGF